MTQYWANVGKARRKWKFYRVDIHELWRGTVHVMSSVLEKTIITKYRRTRTRSNFFNSRIWRMRKKTTFYYFLIVFVSPSEFKSAHVRSETILAFGFSKREFPLRSIQKSGFSHQSAMTKKKYNAEFIIRILGHVCLCKCIFFRLICTCTIADQISLPIKIC